MLKPKFYILLFAIAVLVFSCSDNKVSDNGKDTVKDDLGRKVSVPEKPSRVLSLAPSITEVLYCILPEEKIIARTPFDSVPSQVLKKTVVNNYPVDFEKIAVLNPDIVFAKEGITGLDDAKKIEAMGIPVFYQKYNNLTDIFENIEELGGILNVEGKAKSVCDSLKVSVNQFSHVKKNKKYKPKVLIVISDNPLYVFGKDSYATSLLEAAGGENAVNKIFGNPFPVLRREYVLSINPDIIIGADSSSFFKIYPELKKVNAFKEHRVYEIDKELISRPGPRVTEAIKVLNDIINAE